VRDALATPFTVDPAVRSSTPGSPRSVKVTLPTRPRRMSYLHEKLGLFGHLRAAID
jgi:hypothetical protein